MMISCVASSIMTSPVFSPSHITTILSLIRSISVISEEIKAQILQKEGRLLISL